MSRTKKNSPPRFYRKEGTEERRRVVREDRRRISRETQKLEAFPELFDYQVPTDFRNTEGWETW